MKGGSGRRPVFPHGENNMATLQELIDIVSEEAKMEGINEERLRNLDSVYSLLKQEGRSASEIQSFLRKAFKTTDEEIASLSAKENVTVLDQSE